MTDSKPVAEDPTGHYGPGYADPTTDLPGSPETDAAVESPAETQQSDAEQSPKRDDDLADAASSSSITSDEVHVRPPGRAPASTAPESVNAELNFERS